MGKICINPVQINKRYTETGAIIKHLPVFHAFLFQRHQQVNKWQTSGKIKAVLFGGNKTASL
jgi:hypothetical protein